MNDVLIPKDWEYKDGIYFTVIDPQFFADHRGKRLRFSQNGADFYDIGIKFPAPTAPAAPATAARSKRKGTKAARLPSQDEVLKYVDCGLTVGRS